MYECLERYLSNDVLKCWGHNLVFRPWTMGYGIWPKLLLSRIWTLIICMLYYCSILHSSFITCPQKTQIAPQIILLLQPNHNPRPSHNTPLPAQNPIRNPGLTTGKYHILLYNRHYILYVKCSNLIQSNLLLEIFFSSWVFSELGTSDYRSIFSEHCPSSSQARGWWTE